MNHASKRPTFCIPFLWCGVGVLCTATTHLAHNVDEEICERHAPDERVLEDVVEQAVPQAGLVRFGLEASETRVITYQGSRASK